MPLVLFPSQPLEPWQVDFDFEAELLAAKRAGLEVALIDHTRITKGETGAAVARAPEGSGDALYRGWMLTPEQYGQMHDALAERGVHLLNTPEQYRTTHYLPESYRWIEGHTPRSVWTPIEGEVDFAHIRTLIAPFDDRPIIVKDYVKSQKHYWNEACFIPAASDRAAVERVVRRFLELQGEDLNVGLVFREFVPLKIIGTHPKSGMPLAAEFRIFWLDAEPILAHRYWGDLTTFEAPLPLNALRPIAQRIRSRCFTMDVAFVDDGSWTIVELGDGQVAGLPDQGLAPNFYAQIAGTARAAG